MGLFYRTRPDVEAVKEPATRLLDLLVDIGLDPAYRTKVSHVLINATGAVQVELLLGTITIGGTTTILNKTVELYL